MLHKQNFHRIALMALLTLAANSCSRKPDPAEQNRLGSAYAEILTAQQLFRDDTAAYFRQSDSLARHYGYRDRNDVISRIRSMANSNEDLRPILDSTQHILQKMSRTQSEESEAKTGTKKTGTP